VISDRLERSSKKWSTKGVQFDDAVHGSRKRFIARVLVNAPAA